MIHDLRQEHKNVLLVDAGDFLWQKKYGELRAKTTAKAINMMRYDALNIADGELSYGVDFLNEFAPRLLPLYVGSNITGITDQNITKREKLPWRPYIIKTCNGVKVAVLGVISSDLVGKARIKEDKISIKDPEACLRRILPKAREKADLVVLLSHLGWEQSKELAGRVPGIDLAIVGHAFYPSFEPEKVGSTILLKNEIGRAHV